MGAAPMGGRAGANGKRQISPSPAGLPGGGSGGRRAGGGAVGGWSATKPGRVTIAGKVSDDMAPGTLNSVLKQAGLKEKR
jgi:hypothetical protein